MTQRGYGGLGHVRPETNADGIGIINPTDRAGRKSFKKENCDGNFFKLLLLNIA